MADTAETATDFNRMNPYGPGANADETRQAQHMEANDAPVDVNLNSVVARSQALTVDIAGKGFTANQDLRDKIAAFRLEKSGA
jgi:hypothetical protein